MDFIASHRTRDNCKLHFVRFFFIHERQIDLCKPKIFSSRFLPIRQKPLRKKKYEFCYRPVPSLIQINRFEMSGKNFKTVFHNASQNNFYAINDTNFSLKQNNKKIQHLLDHKSTAANSEIIFATKLRVIKSKQLFRIITSKQETCHGFYIQTNEKKKKIIYIYIKIKIS